MVKEITVKERNKEDVLSYGIEVTAYDNYLEYNDIFPLTDISFENITVKSPNKKKNI